jgi:hypothetical protein
LHVFVYFYPAQSSFDLRLSEIKIFDIRNSPGTVDDQVRIEDFLGPGNMRMNG